MVSGADSHTLTNECPDVYLNDFIMSLKFSPTQNILASGQITGDLRVYSCSEQDTKERIHLTHHSESIRALDYNEDGSILYTGSSDHSFSVVTLERMEG